jgi:hypothetical protein
MKIIPTNIITTVKGKVGPFVKEYWKVLLIWVIVALISFVAWRCDVKRFNDTIQSKLPWTTAVQEELAKVKEENNAFKERYGVISSEQDVINEAKKRADKNLSAIRAKKENVKKEISNVDKNKSMEVLVADIKRLGYSPIIIHK